MELHDEYNIVLIVVVAIVHYDNGDEDKFKTIMMCSEIEWECLMVTILFWVLMFLSHYESDL